jgi:hypothetical protein
MARVDAKNTEYSAGNGKPSRPRNRPQQDSAAAMVLTVLVALTFCYLVGSLLLRALRHLRIELFTS